eukprot:TRINITY_DN82857_c0_g1_i1.p1 TRINITY_DN82857_c0_g1~~TRINITY_DN82857_c0_g1_i1.p1  ORF type:complete len:117 (-),score=7.00 TRINITY_DN82857_c0_g1_i1:185-535(-)
MPKLPSSIRTLKSHSFSSPSPKPYPFSTLPPSWMGRIKLVAAFFVLNGGRVSECEGVGLTIGGPRVSSSRCLSSDLLTFRHQYHVCPYYVFLSTSKQTDEDISAPSSKVYQRRTVH